MSYKNTLKITINETHYFHRAHSVPIPNSDDNISWAPSELLQSKTATISSDISLQQITYTELEERLREFYHWRGQLLIFIQKFANILKPTYWDREKNKDFEFVLYHGVNDKMILDPSSTQSFYGPLSTTSSYYVALQFATRKGMILSLSSEYPRLKMCSAFNASTISDYPDEQEWIIGHIYMRIRKIYIRFCGIYWRIVNDWLFLLYIYLKKYVFDEFYFRRYIIGFIQPVI